MRAFFLLIPIGLLGLIRWSSWLVRRIPAVLYLPYPRGHRQPLTVVTPVYQEDPVIFRAAVRSWLANPGVEEVIAVVDETDTVCIEAARRLAATAPVTVIVTDVPGKRDALRRGWEAAKTELVALVDSDTIWADDVAARVAEPFGDPDIGGVGTRQNVLNPASLWQRINDFYLDSRYFDEVAGQTQWGQAVSCLSGRTAVYRRSLLLEVSDDFMNETFLGVPCNSGEDKRLTMLTLQRGYRTWMQQNARVWSTFPPGMRMFFRQRMRWSRNTWRSDLRALRQGWVFRHKWLAFSMLDKAVSSFTLLVAPVFLLGALVSGHFAVAGLLVLWWLVSRTIKYLPHLQRRPVDAALLPVFIATTFVVAALKIVALLTVRRQRWLTRDVEVVDGRVIRIPQTAAGRAAAAGTARVRWQVTGAVAGLVALLVGTAGLAHAAQRRDPAVVSVVAAPPAPRAAASSWPAAAAPVIPAAGVAPATPAAASAADLVPCRDPADPATAADGDPARSPSGSPRANPTYVPTRLLQTGCSFPVDHRVIVVEAGRIKLQAGGAVVRSIPRAQGGPLTLSELAAAIGDPAWLAEVEPSVWELRAAVFQQPGTTLLVGQSGGERLTVRLVDLPHLFVGGRGARAEYRNVEVTSWNRNGGGPDADYQDGRPFVLYLDGSTLNISGSTFTQLGSDRPGASGVSWRRGESGGTVSSSVFSHNFSGVHTYEASGLTFTDSHFEYNNTYGADPHDGSSNLAFVNCTFEFNGGDGLNVSRGVTGVEVDESLARQNTGSGFVISGGSSGVRLDRNSSVENGLDGIAILDSPDNTLLNNSVAGNRVGIRIHGPGSAGNLLSGNELTGNLRGMELYGGAVRTRIEGGFVTDSLDVAIVSEAAGTVVNDQTITGGRVGIDLRGPATVARTVIGDVDVGVAVRSSELVVLEDVSVTARVIGVRVDRRAEAQLNGGQVRAPQPYKGSEQIIEGGNVRLRTSAPPGLHLFGLAGFAFLVVALTLEAVRRVRTRGQPELGRPPSIVAGNAT